MYEKKEKVFRLTLLALSLFLIGVGIFRQEHLEVLRKAIQICFSCIGIG